jgi:hypothetical protein
MRAGSQLRKMAIYNLALSTLKVSSSSLKTSKVSRFLMNHIYYKFSYTGLRSEYSSIVDVTGNAHRSCSFARSDPRCFMTTSHMILTNAPGMKELRSSGRRSKYKMGGGASGSSFELTEASSNNLC